MSQNPTQLDATVAKAQVPWSKEIERRFEERLKERMKVELPDEAADPKSTAVKDVRKPSFLPRQDGYLVQVEVVYPDKTILFWCLFFDGEPNAVVVPFLDRKTSIPDVIDLVGPERIRIDPETIRDYVVEFINYELARGAEAGLLVSDLNPRSRTFLGMLDWPTPLEESDKLAIEEYLSKHGMQVHSDTDHSLVVQACMVERDALVWREFRVFTETTDEVYSGKKGQVDQLELEPQVLLRDLPDNCRAKPGASLGIPQERFAADADGWEKIPPEDVRSIRSDLDRHIKPEVRVAGDPEGWELVLPMDGLPICSDLDQRTKPELDSTQSVVWSRQHLACYDLDLLKIEPANSDEKWIVAHRLGARVRHAPAVGLDLVSDSRF